MLLLWKLSDLPLEMLETVLMRAFLMLYVRDFETDDTDDGRRQHCGKSRSSERRAFTMLSSVCWNWHLTLTGWPDSPTGQWVRHQLTKLIQRKSVILAVCRRLLDYYLRQGEQSCFRRCLSVCLSVCFSATLRKKTFERICMKFSGKVGNRPMDKRLNFGGDLEGCGLAGVFTVLMFLVMAGRPM